MSIEKTALCSVQATIPVLVYTLRCFIRYEALCASCMPIHEHSSRMWCSVTNTAYDASPFIIRPTYFPYIPHSNSCHTLIVSYYTPLASSSSNIHSWPDLSTRAPCKQISTSSVALAAIYPKFFILPQQFPAITKQTSSSQHITKPQPTIPSFCL